MAVIPEQTLLSGYKIPCVGLGTWESKPGDFRAAVKTAIGLGYRHFDCALAYGNEKEIGEAFKEITDEGTVKREELFITTKLWNTYHSKARVLEGCKESLTNFGLDYIDLYIIHWPFATRENDGLYPLTPDGKTDVVDIDFIETWTAMQDLVDEGMCRSIGVSNFNSKQIQRILDLGLKHPLSCNQIEISPYHSNENLLQFCQSKGIVVVAYSPLGSAERPWAKPDDPKLLEEPEIAKIATRYSKSPGQVVLRWGVQRGYIVIPKSVSAARMTQNTEDNIPNCGTTAALMHLALTRIYKKVYSKREKNRRETIYHNNLFDFELNDDEMKFIHGMNRNARCCLWADASHSPYYPFKEEV